MKKILFQGDSVTDAGRTSVAGESLGEGYPMLIDHLFRKEEEDVCVINRGISGNRSIDLLGRWQKDCIEIQPDLVTILIGINDCWRKYDSNDETSIDDYEEHMAKLLEQTKAKTKAKIILMEPFVLPHPNDRKAWRVTLDPQIHVLRLLAREYGASFIPLDGIMNQAGIHHGYAAICEDGVHPTKLGHETIANAWMDFYRKM